MGKKSVDWTTILAELEKLVVEGRHDDVKMAIRKYDLNRIPRSAAASLAEIAWRITEPLLTLKLLNGFVFPENEFAHGPLDREKFIYATALGNLGAVNEAIQIFESIDSGQEPEVNLRKALAYFRVWNYHAAIPLLKDFLGQPDVAPYRRLIGKVNLAAALIVECRYDEAADLLAQIQTECTVNSYLLLLGNTFEMQAQIQFFRRNYDESIGLAESALKLLQAQDGDFYIFAEKWKLVGQAFKKKDHDSISALRAFREKARTLSEWETVRECDLFEAILTSDNRLARQVVLGTPHEAYRQRARRMLGENIPSLGKFNLVLPGSVASDRKFVFNPYEVQSGNEALHSKPQLLALFHALTVDFYRPSHIGLLFQRIYADEKFNSFTSPKRVLTLMKRLNVWFANQGVPLSVRLKKSEFRLVAKGELDVHVQIHRAQVLSKQAGHLTLLREIFKHRTFSSQRVADAMNLSRSSAQQLIHQGVAAGVIAKQGTGRGTTYAFATRVRKKAAA